MPVQPPESAGQVTTTIATPDALMPTVWGGIDGGTLLGVVGTSTGGSTTGSVGGSATTGGSTGVTGFVTDSQSPATMSSVSAFPLSLPAPQTSESVMPSRRSTTSSASPRFTVTTLDGRAQL